MVIAHQLLALAEMVVDELTRLGYKDVYSERAKQEFLADSRKTGLPPDQYAIRLFAQSVDVALRIYGVE